MIGISLAILCFKHWKREFLPWILLSFVFVIGFGYLASPNKERIDYVSAQDARYLRLVNNVECVQKLVRENDLKAGISGYKEANPYTILSNGEVFLYPVKGKSAKPLNWLVSGIGLEREFDFALVTAGIEKSYYKIPRAYYRLGRIVVEEAFGPPIRSAACGNLEVLIYSKLAFGRSHAE